MNAISRVLLSCSAFLALAAFQSCPAAAQSACIAFPSCSAYSLYNTTCIPALPPGVFDCDYFAGTKTCKVYTNNCAPAAAPPETGGGCKSCSAGQPISLADGNTYISESDLKVPGLGGGLTLERTWNSKWPPTQNVYRVGLFGPNWRSTFEERIFTGDDGYIKYSRANGTFWSFGYNGSNWLPAAPQNASTVLTATDTVWVLTFKNGEQRVFDKTSGWLTSITDRNGNVTQLSYDGLNRLTSVADPAGRHLYFAYAGSSSYQVVGVTSDIGITLSYSYDPQARLLQVTKPDQSTWNFQYDSNSFITAVTDSSGKVLESHTYDAQGRGLTSSRAGGVEAVTVRYSP